MKALTLVLAGLSIVLQACAPAAQDANNSTALALSTEQRTRLQVAAVRLQQAEDLRAVKRLEHTLAQYLSAGRWRDAVALFAGDARFVIGERVYAGNEQIAARLQQLTGALPGQGLVEGHLFENVVLSPVLNVMGNGESAFGRWRSLSMTGEWRESASWHVAINENRYIKEDGQWKFAEFNHHPVFAGSYEEGWRNLKEETPGTVAPVPFHYDVERAGMPATVVTTSQSALVAVDDPQRLLASLEQRAQRLLDEDAIINLQNALGYYLDRKLWDDAVELFHPEGSLEFGRAGIYRGHAGIRRALEQFGPAGLPNDEVFDHVQLQPVVTLAADGQRARLRGAEISMVGRHQGDSRFGVSVHLNDFIKRDGIWMLDRVHVYTRLLTDYTQGWARHAQSPPAALPGFEADAAPSVRYEAWPASFVPPFAERSVIGQAAPADVDATEFDGRLGALEGKVLALHAYNGAENVANAYGYSIDEFLWDDMADLFAREGWKELSNVGRYTGRERIRQSVVDRYGRGGRRANSMTFHQKTQPVITVGEDGNSASIRTRLYQLNSSLQNAGSYMSGIYENTAVLEDGVWKLSSMDLDYTWSAGYQGGWSAVVVREGGTAPAPGSALQGEGGPDAPLRGRVTPAYPTEPVDMAFHYDNPVSGREPPLRLREREAQHGP